MRIPTQVVFDLLPLLHALAQRRFDAERNLSWAERFLAQHGVPRVGYVRDSHSSIVQERIPRLEAELRDLRRSMQDALAWSAYFDRRSCLGGVPRRRRHRCHDPHALVDLFEAELALAALAGER